MAGEKSLFGGVKWVFIDLDDTLWDFSANSDVTLQKLYRNFGTISYLAITVPYAVEIFKIIL